MDTPSLRRRRRLAAPVALLFAALVALVAPQTCAACSCIVQTFTEAADRADVIVVGTVSGSAPAGADELGPSIAVTFAVSEVYKGSAPAEVVVRTADNSAACGVAFEEGQSYLVLAASDADGLRTDLCSGTALAGDVAAEDLDSLGAAAAPAAMPPSEGGVASSDGGNVSSDGGSGRVAFIAGGAALGALLVGLLLRLQRRGPRGAVGPGADPETRGTGPGTALPHTEAT